MKNLLLSNALKALLIVAVTIITALILFIPPRLVLLRITAADNAQRDAIRVYAKGMLWPGTRPPSLGNTYLFIIAGSGRVFVRGSKYQPAEFELGSTCEVFRGTIQHSSVADVLYNIHIYLANRDETLHMEMYEGLIGGQDRSGPEVLVVHSRHHTIHTSLKLLQRNCINKGINITTLPYIMLIADTAADSPIGYKLDFSHAYGGIRPYLPPDGWPHGNLYRRILYSLDGEAPANGYQTIMPLPPDQQSTPYQMGKIFFYCVIHDHYGAGAVNLPSVNGQARVTLWLNSAKGDRTIYYPR